MALHQVACAPRLRVALLAVLAGGLFSQVSLGQPFFGEQPQPDIPPVVPGPEPSSTPTLFVPVKPGTPSTPAPAATAAPVSTPTLFIPSDIPAPAVQATGETVDLIPEPDPEPARVLPIPTQSAQPLPTSPSPLLQNAIPPSTSPFLQSAAPTGAVPATAAPLAPGPVQTSPFQAGPIQTQSAAPVVASDVIPIPSATPAAASRPSFGPAPTPVPYYVPESASVASATPTPRKRSAPAPTTQTISQSQINTWVAQATERRDPALATDVGWAYFNRNEYSSAGVWFNQALEWNANSGEAAYGLALSKFREGDISSAEAITNFRAGSYPKMRTLQGDIYSRRGTEAYEAKQYQESLNQFNKAAAARPLSRNEQVIVAWDYYYLRQYDKSAQLFESLYRRSPDDVTAQGLYAALSKQGNYQKLETVAGQKGGSLKKVYITYDSRRYFQSNLFLAAADTGGAKVYPVLRNYTTPSVAAGFTYRSKSGTEGEGQLQAITIPAIQGQVYPANKFMLSGYLSHLILDSGDLPDGAQVGTVPRNFTPYTYEMNTRENNLWEFAVRLEYQDWLSWYITLGSTPLNGPLQARPVGNAGIIYRNEKGYFQAEIYSKAIKESMTSWVGSVDPYSGNKWGRVTETGISGTFFRGIAGDNTIFLKGGYGSIMGTNVEDNWHAYGTAAFSHVFKKPGFEYITLGVALSGEAFDNNQNHFTYGNGGYFSPEYLIQGLVQAQFLTDEGRNWIAAGSAGAGLQNNKQAASPLFPLNPDGREFDSVDSTTGIGLVQLQGAYLIDGNWLLGASLNYAVTADYNEGSISIWVRYFFDRRYGLLRTDLLGFDHFQQ